MAAQEVTSTLTEPQRQDHRLLLSIVEGESDVVELLDSIAEYIKGRKAVVEQAEQRIKRVKAQAEKGTDLFNRIAEAAGLPDRIERAFYLTGMQDDTPQAIITDPDLIPRSLMKPDRVETGKLLRRGEEVPGAVLSNPGRHRFFRWV